MNQPVARRNLRFNSNDDVIAEIGRLRRGYAMSGSWSLGQVCWHLNAVTTALVRPPPHPEADPVSPGVQEALEKILSDGRLPFRIDAPERVVPPATAGDSDIEQFLGTLERLRTFCGPYAPHRIFGKLPDVQMRRLTLIHYAHHFSFLVPATERVALTVEG